MSELLAVDLTDALASIRSDWDAPLAPLRAVRAGTGGGKPGSLANSPSPVPVALSDARLDVATSLFGWCSATVDERGLRHAVVNQADVPGMCNLLATHAEWWSLHEAGPDMVDEVAERARRLHALVVPDRKRTVRIGTCPLVVDEADTRCGGRVYADPEAGEAACGTCRTVEPIEWWRDLLPAAQYVTIRELTQALIYEGVGMEERAVRSAVDKGAVDVVGKDARGRRLVHRGDAIAAILARTRQVA